MSDADTGLRARVERFLFEEAQLLDEGRFDEWLALYAEDAVYWVPSQPGQNDPQHTASIMYEDVAVLEMRVRRLSHPRAYAFDPAPRTTHLVGNVVVEDARDGLVIVASALVMTEFRGDAITTYSGRVRHELRPQGDSFLIARKRVDLINCDGVHGVITVPF